MLQKCFWKLVQELLWKFLQEIIWELMENFSGYSLKNNLENPTNFSWNSYNCFMNFSGKYLRKFLLVFLRNSSENFSPGIPSDVPPEYIMRFLPGSSVEKFSKIPFSRNFFCKFLQKISPTYTGIHYKIFPAVPLEIHPDIFLHFF